MYQSHGPRLKQRRTRRVAKCSADWLKWVSFVCLMLGTFSAAVIQGGIMHLDSMTNTALYEAISPGGSMMGWASLAVVTMLFGTLGIPIYAKLLCVGWEKTRNQTRYLLRLAGLALISEIPYDLAMRGTWFDFSRQNPVWALVICGVLLAIINQYDKKGFGGIMLKLVVVVAALAWAALLQSYMGALTVLLVACFTLLKKHKTASSFVGGALCLLQFPAPFGMFLVHWYDGTKGNTPRILFYILYPLHLILFAIIRAMI